MRAIDTTFVIDALKGHPGAAARTAAMANSGEAVGIPVPVLAEVMVGAHFVGGAHLENTMEFVGQFEVLEADRAVALEAGRIGAKLRRVGARLSAADLLVAATCTRAGIPLLTRDAGFSAVPGLLVEAY